MRRNIIETVMGGVVLLVAIVFLVFVFSSSGVRSVSGYEVVAEFDDLTAAQAWADADPYVSAGVYQEVRVKPFIQVLPR